MGPMILRPGQRILTPGGSVMQPSMAALTQWWLSGGIPAANCIAAYQPKGAADLASSYINLANPGTFNAAPGVAPTFNTATGWTFNATQYLSSGVTPTNDQSWSMIIRYSGAASSSGYAAAYTNGTSRRFEIFPRFTDGKSYLANGQEIGVSGALAAGVLALAGATAYRDGSSIGTIPSGSGTLGILYIGANNAAGTATSFYSGNIQAIAIYNISIASYMPALTTAINAL